MSGEGVNVPLLRKAVEWAEAQAALPPVEREWEQSAWHLTPAQRAARFMVDSSVCGTSYCVAGYLAAQHDSAYAETAFPDGLPDAADLAADLLGIPIDEADRPGGLFDAFNDAADVRRIAEDIAGERL